MESLLRSVGRHLEEQDRNTFQKILKLAHKSLEMERNKKVLWVCEKKSDMMTWALQQNYSGGRGDTSIHLMSMKTESVSRSVVSDSLQPHERSPLGFFSMGFSRQEYWSGLPLPLQGIFPTQGSNLGLLHCRQILYHLTHQEAIADSKINPSSALPRLSLQTIFAQPSGHPLVNEK